MTKIDGQVNIQALRQLYEDDEVAKALLDHLRSRERNRHNTPVDNLKYRLSKEGCSVNRGSLINVFRELEKIGCGRFVVGRRGQQSRFEWDVRMVDVGGAASGQQTKIGPVPEADDEEHEDDDQIIAHSFQLRPNLNVTVRLPINFSSIEASRLAGFIRTLPFETKADAPGGK